MAKKALVTGASEGIGQAIARKLKDEGYLITSVARSETKLKAFTQELGAGHDYIVADLSIEAGQNKIAGALDAQHYDVLINNAGVGTVGDFTDVPLDRQISMLRLNAEAVVRLAYAFLKNSKDGDALINVSSALAFMPMPGMGLYSATKSFVTAFSDTLWFEQKKRGVYVMGLHPGITATNFQTAAGGRKEDLPEGMAQTSEQVAEVAIRELKARKKPTVISGGKNAIFAGTSRILPRKSIVTMTGNMMKKK